MNCLIINLSPRTRGTSNMLAAYFEDRIRPVAGELEVVSLYPNLNKMELLIHQVKQADCLVFIGLCYVTSNPAEVIHFLHELSQVDGVLHGQSLYGFIQGGMPYAHTHEHGLRLLENFAEEMNLEYKGGFSMGGGAMLDGQPLDKLIGRKKMVPAVNEFIGHIIKNESTPNELYLNAQIKFPGIVNVILAAALNWRVKKRLTDKGIEYKAKSPYLVDEA